MDRTLRHGNLMCSVKLPVPSGLRRLRCAALSGVARLGKRLCSVLQAPQFVLESFVTRGVSTVPALFGGAVTVRNWPSRQWLAWLCTAARGAARVAADASAARGPACAGGGGGAPAQAHRVYHGSQPARRAPSRRHSANPPRQLLLAPPAAGPMWSPTLNKPKPLRPSTGAWMPLQPAAMLITEAFVCC